MNPIRSEGDFQRWVMSTLLGLGAHIQDHRLSNLPHIPDMSAALNGLDMWLELKYGRFSMAAGPEGRDYDDFEFKEVTRGQLDWLISRKKAGQARCGILGYMDIFPTRYTQYVFYMDADLYLEKVYKAKTKGGPPILSRHVIPLDDVIKAPTTLWEFLKHGGLEFHVSTHYEPQLPRL